MKQISDRFSVVMVIYVLLVSCSSSEAPNCSDNSVKKLVIEIIEGKIRDYMVMLPGAVALKDLRDKIGKNSNEIDAALMLGLQGRLTYNTLNELQRKYKDEGIKNILESVDKQIADAGITLSGIRTNERNNEIRKCKCSADLVSAETSGSVDYTAQYTEDGKIHVEVSGL